MAYYHREKGFLKRKKIDNTFLFRCCQQNLSKSCETGLILRILTQLIRSAMKTEANSRTFSLHTSIYFHTPVYQYLLKCCVNPDCRAVLQLVEINFCCTGLLASWHKKELALSLKILNFHNIFLNTYLPRPWVRLRNLPINYFGFSSIWTSCPMSKSSLLPMICKTLTFSTQGILIEIISVHMIKWGYH